MWLAGGAGFCDDPCSSRVNLSVPGTWTTPLGQVTGNHGPLTFYTCAFVATQRKGGETHMHRVAVTAISLLAEARTLYPFRVTEVALCLCVLQDSLWTGTVTAYCVLILSAQRSVYCPAWIVQESGFLLRNLTCCRVFFFSIEDVRFQWHIFEKFLVLLPHLL